VQAGSEKRAVGADVLAAAIAKNQAAAVTRYSIPGGTGPEFSVKFTGVVGKGDFGSYPVTVPSLRKSLVINVQTGPAILGTDLRDATGTIAFGQFTNQIEYQNAGSALNKEMKKDVLAKIDTAHLSGKTVSVVGAFVLSDPNNWVVTPVELSVR
jgi:predicted lipoprotein